MCWNASGDIWYDMIKCYSAQSSCDNVFDCSAVNPRIRLIKLSSCTAVLKTSMEMGISARFASSGKCVCTDIVRNFISLESLKVMEIGLLDQNLCKMYDCRCKRLPSRKWPRDKVMGETVITGYQLLTLTLTLTVMLSMTPISTQTSMTVDLCDGGL